MLPEGGEQRIRCAGTTGLRDDEYVIEGIDTNLDLHRRIVRNGDFASGACDIHWLERWIDGD